MKFTLAAINAPLSRTGNDSRENCTPQRNQKDGVCVNDTVERNNGKCRAGNAGA